MNGMKIATDADEDTNIDATDTSIDKDKIKTRIR